MSPINAQSLSLPEPSSDLTLRLWESADFECVISAATDTYIPLVTSIPANCDESQSLDWIQSQNAKFAQGVDLPFCISLRHPGEMERAVGMIGIFAIDVVQASARCGYWIDPRARGKGYAKLALEMITPWAFSVLELQIIELHIEPENGASISVAEKVGYRKVGEGWREIGDQARRRILCFTKSPFT